MSQKVKESIEVEESKIIEEQNKQKEEKKKKEWIKGIKVPQKTLWEEGIVKSPIVAFEDFKINKDDFNIVKNEEEKYLFALTNILSIYITDETDCNKIIIKNLKTFLEDKKVVLKIGRLKIFLTLDKVLIKEIGNITEFDYDIFEFNDAYLQNWWQTLSCRNVLARTLPCRCWNY